MKRPPDVSGIAGGNSDLKPVGGGGVSLETLKARAREMRNNPTEPERRLWQALKGKQLVRYKFRRQQVFGARIIDFYCAAAKLAIEVDGDSHDADVDARRDARLFAERGVQTVRYTSLDVMRNLDGVLVSLTEILRRSNHPPNPDACPGEGRDRKEGE